MTQIIFSARGFDLDPNSKQYLSEKVHKHQKLLEKATGITALFELSQSHRGVEQDYRIELSVKMPLAFIKVEENGSRLNEIIDKIDVTLKRRLSRYHEQFQRWEKQKPWKEKVLNDEIRKAENADPEITDTDYSPTIRRKTYEDDRPMHPAEAVEQMELLGHNSFLFKNLESSKYAMIQKLPDGSYELIEPE
jgi:putative sigma-54 modulation protein